MVIKKISNQGFNKKNNMDFEITDYANPLLDTGFKQLMSLEGEGGDV
jgi:hypothetical protein